MKKILFGFFMALALVLTPFLVPAPTANAMVCIDLQIPPNPVLKVGSKGNNVANAQSALVQLGYTPGPIDGIFGSKTRAATFQYQLDRSLGADGVIGPVTSARIKLDTCATTGTNTGVNNPVNPVNPANPANPTNTTTTNPVNPPANNNTGTNTTSTTNTGANNNQNQPGTTMTGFQPCDPTTPPFVGVSTPNGGETYVNQAGVNIDVEWVSCNLADTLPSIVSIFDATGTSVFIANLTTNPGKHSFALPAVGITAGKNFQVRIVVTDAAGVSYTDLSDDTFSLIDPLGGANPAGPNAGPAPAPVNPVGCNSVTLFSPINGQPCVKPGQVAPAPGPGPTTTDICALNPNASAIVMSPNGGETLVIGAHTQVTWMPCKANGDISISLQDSNGMEYVIVAATPNDGTEAVMMTPLSPTQVLAVGKYKLVIREVATATVQDSSDDFFVLQ